MTDLPPPDYHHPGPGHNPYGAPDPYSAADPVQPAPRTAEGPRQPQPPQPEPPLVDPRVGYAPLPLPDPQSDPGGPTRLKWLLGGGIGLVALIVAAVVLAAVVYGGTGTEENPTATHDAEAEITVATTAPPSLLPGDGGAEAVDTVMQPLFAGLTRTDPDTGLPQNLLAADISSDDAVEWSVTVESGYTFHNDEPVTAQSFVEAWNVVAAGENDLDGSFFLDRIAGFAAAQDDNEPLSGLTVIDDHSFTVELDEPWAGFPATLANPAFAPMADACLEADDLCASQPVGNGPFKLDDSWSDGDPTMPLTRWDEYAGEPAELAAIEFRLSTSTTLDGQDYLAGAVDLARMPADQVDDVDPDLMHAAATGSFRYLGMPVDAEGYGDPDFRHALSLAIDRESVIAETESAHLQPTSGYTPEAVAGHAAESCSDCRFDPEAAVDRLEESQWPQDKPVEFAYPESEVDAAALLTEICDGVTSVLGLDCEATAMESAEFASALEAGELPGAWAGHWIPDSATSEAFLTPLYASGPDGNDSGYHNPDFESLLSEGNQAGDLDAALDAYAEAEALLDEDMPVVPFASGLYQLAHTDRIDPGSIFVDPMAQTLQFDLLQAGAED